MYTPVFTSGVWLADVNEAEHNDELCLWSNVLEQLLQHPKVLDTMNVPDAAGGRALSSVHLAGQMDLLKLLKVRETRLGHWLLYQLYDAAKALGFDKTRDIRKFKFHRVWANEMSKGCEAVAHRHASRDWVIPHMVAIFYVDVPANGADLVFLDEDGDEMRLGSLTSFSLSQQYRLQSRRGRLICHDAKQLHATTIHESDLPRRCIIIEVGFPPK
ncbi:hypothetical protein KJI95_03075 [Shewanella sp. JM162201]|uniref:Phytanoyl-CoA dioxygenase (PhyH) n=1 Tax=Shewanella jiangmenensis TaxID=2837387 RepID=A0ABS5UZ91_9GAMM|nr:putative 2OG-Fe(II) oxygenase [Shewanella jiangmenensis]MBT1443504.1 hypothetical protein [Shewanella jiangmenensis]